MSAVLQPVPDSIARLEPAELERRRRAADRLVRAEAAGLLLHDAPDDDPVGTWRIDPLPLVLTAETWAVLADGLRERAELLQGVLADLHGPRELLRAGVVPVEALIGHASTLLGGPGRPGPPPRLGLVGADLLLDAAGNVHVVADDTDVPRGDGQALLARSIVHRVLPPPGPSLGLVDHGAYLAGLRAALAGAAPPGRASPRTVVVTTGPASPGYVEDAYLATQLGYSLAEAADVVTRHGRAWLRSLDGLEPIDVVLRRIPEDQLDPVEDDAAGPGGVPGLVAAGRAGGVTIVNPAHVSMASSAALRPFLDEVARFLLGRPLALAAPVALWCGDPAQREEVLAAPERFVIHDTAVRGASRHPPAGPAAVVGAELDEPDLAAWLARIRARPERFVAQARVHASVSLRTQVLLTGDAPAVLPGGCARMLDDGTRAFDHRRVRRDVWVLDPRRRDRLTVTPTPAPAVPQVDLRRSLPTRAAEAMYWTGRTAERAETGARTVLVCLTQLAGAEPGPSDVRAIARALRAAGGGLAGETAGDVAAAGVDAGGADDTVIDREVRAALSGRPGSVVASLRSTVTTAAAARQVLSTSTWRLLTMLDAEATALDKVAGTPRVAATLFDATEALDRVLVPLAALAGLTDESVVRGPAWRFLDIGRRIERALLVLGLAEALLDPPAWSDQRGALRADVMLAACESLVAYRQRHRSDVTLEGIGDLLLADPTNPRSVRFQLDQLAVDLQDLPDRPVRQRQLAAVRAAQRELERHLPLTAVVTMVVAVREPVLEVGNLMPGGWFTPRPRRWWSA